jgi:hypothetical protein
MVRSSISRSPRIYVKQVLMPKFAPASGLDMLARMSTFNNC